MRIFGWAGDDCCVSEFVVGHFFSSLKNLLGAVLFVGIIEMLEGGGWQETYAEKARNGVNAVIATASTPEDVIIYHSRTIHSASAQHLISHK